MGRSEGLEWYPELREEHKEGWAAGKVGSLENLRDCSVFSHPEGNVSE